MVMTMSEQETDRSADGRLRCGACWRDVFGTAHGQRWHTVFADGSMRCWAPDTLEQTGDETRLDYVGTFVVHATEERRQLIVTALDHQQQMDDHVASQMDALRLSHE